MNLKKNLSVVTLLAISASGFSQPEVKAGANIYAPFIHRKYYCGEREQAGYNPLYHPNIVSFDQRNRPYIRDGAGFIHTLNQTEKWIKIDFKPFIKKAYPQWNGQMHNGPFAEERIVFDKDGDAYMHAMISRHTRPKSLLLYSRDKCRSWKIYQLPDKFGRWFVKLENRSPAQRLSQPPVLSIFNGKRMYILKPEKFKAGLKLGNTALVAEHALMVPTHSGGGNFTVTIPGKTYIIFAGSDLRPGKEGTPQYISVYDHNSKRCSVPVYIGNNGQGKPDPHNLPAICMDSKGFIHLLLGSHHDPFIYMRSAKPYDLTAWTKPESLGYPKTKMAEGSYTYIGILCDRFDNLHLTARWAGDGYKNYLIYMKKPVGRDWLPQQKLVEPFKTLYSCYYHKMSQDLLGRIFINYSYYGNELTKEQSRVYDKNWPEHKIFAKGIVDTLNGHFYMKVKNNDPVMLVSNDAGNSFRLALTPDFSRGIKNKLVSKGTTTNSIGMPMVTVPGGSYIMGSLNGAKDEMPLRPVEIENDFSIGKYPVRVKDFEAFVKATGYKTEFERTKDKKTIYNWCGGKFLPGDDRTWKNPKIPQTGDHPVVMITVNDAREFCKWLSQKEKCVYRLPTEAEWEYACRAGTFSDYYFGDDTSVLPKYAWFKKNAAGTKPVGLLMPNRLGIYDMHGNVWEYCEDYYIPRRSDLPCKNPLVNKVKISGPVIRGGSWIDDRFGGKYGFNLRSACRYHIVYPLIQLDWVGFRVLKEIRKSK